MADTPTAAMPRPLPLPENRRQLEHLLAEVNDFLEKFRDLISARDSERTRIWKSCERARRGLDQQAWGGQATPRRRLGEPKWPTETLTRFIDPDLLEEAQVYGLRADQLERGVEDLVASGQRDVAALEFICGLLGEQTVAMTGYLRPFDDLRFRILGELDALKEDAQSDDSRDVPKWDADRCELWFRGERLRKYRPIAMGCAILAAFEEDGWPARIDSPLKPEADLTRAVRSLNKDLEGIRFERDGGGEGIVWRDVSRM